MTATHTTSRVTVRDAGEAWVEAAKAGRALTRSGAPYKPSVIRTHKRDLERYINPDLGAVRLSNLRRRDVQSVVDRLVAPVRECREEALGRFSFADGERCRRKCRRISRRCSS